MSFLCNLFCSPKKGDANGKPLAHWQLLKANKRVQKTVVVSTHADLERWVPIQDDFWETTLTKQEYRVLRKKGTEGPCSSVYDKFYPRTGHFCCKACGLPMYHWDSKFDSESGWPSFGCHIENSIITRDDFYFGTRRIELCCRRCQSHLGHVFKETNRHRHDRLKTFTERQCINGICLHYIRSNNLPHDISTTTTALDSP